PASAYLELAELARYEGMKVWLKTPDYAAALAKVDATDAARRKADFTLTDLGGKKWTLSKLRGNVVVVNFWATWCPPCRKEMPDLEKLYHQFKPKGLVILSISDEPDAKVRPFIAEHKYSYPILLDPGRKVNERYRVAGIPKSFVYDRRGRMVAQSIDMRTRWQFLALLAKAGLH
ncbi:MAG: TlpA family protein disulfide reductase, partial [Fimbriimonas ginsengisoli]|nr:TlpA family protein disulfide reductase [Fimbriimonas ginsengisoli]